jgi:hypothetical protein
MRLVLQRWKAHLRCGVCDKSLADEAVLYEVVLPYVARWKWPRTSYHVTRTGVRYLIRVGLSCPRCHVLDDGPPGKFAVAFLCGKHATIGYSQLLTRITHAVRIDSLPYTDGLPRFDYDPDRVLVSYVPVRQLVCVLPGLRKLPPEAVHPPKPSKQGD